MAGMPHVSPVVVAYDLSDSSRAVLDRAIALADRAPFHVLHFVCAIEPHGGVPALPHHGHVDYAYSEQVQRHLSHAIAQALHDANIVDRVHFYVHARIGKAAEEILGLAREIGADLILVGSHGRVGLERVVLGSVSERVVREAGCTVEVVRPKAYADVALIEVTEVEPSRHYVPPHRYTYEQPQVSMRPDEWPRY